jgi:tetratricopeptide (TPR) repeat protein
MPVGNIPTQGYYFNEYVVYFYQQITGMKKFFLFVALMALQGKMIAQADKKFNDLLQKGIKQVHDERKHDEAILTFNEAVKLKPSSADVYGYRGFTYLEKAELEEYKSDEDYINYGKNKSWQLALKDFNKCIELDPTIASAFYYRGMAYAMNREIKNAMADYNKAQQLDPTDKKIPEAIKECKEHFVSYSIDMVRDEIDNGLDTHTKGNKDSLYRNNMRLAVQFCTDAIPYDTENNRLFYYRAQALYWLNKYGAADADIKRALVLKPGDADALTLQKQIKELMDFNK